MNTAELIHSDPDFSPEVKLWLAVLIDGLAAATYSEIAEHPRNGIGFRPARRFKPRVLGRQPSGRWHREWLLRIAVHREALSWLYGADTGFEEICAALGLDPDLIRLRARKHLPETRGTLAAAVLGKDVRALLAAIPSCGRPQ